MPLADLRLWDPGTTMRASRNLRTGAIVFPPVPATSPLAAWHDAITIGRDGALYSYTVIYPNPKSGQAPHALGYVDFADREVRLFGRLQGTLAPVIGTRYRAVPDEAYGYVFDLVADGETA